MPKARKRTGKSRIAQSRVGSATGSRTDNVLTSQGRANSVETAGASRVNRPFVSPRVSGPQNLIMPGMVALGCWLMAYTLFFLSTDPNRNLFGGMAVLMALLWTYSFSTRMRKLLLLRRKA